MMAKFVPIQSYRPLLDDDAYYAPTNFGSEEYARSGETEETRTRGESEETGTRDGAQKSEDEGSEENQKRSSTCMDDIYTPEKSKEKKDEMVVIPRSGPLIEKSKKKKDEMVVILRSGSLIEKVDGSMNLLNADTSNDSGLYSSPFFSQSSSPMVSTPIANSFLHSKDTVSVGTLSCQLGLDQCSPDGNALDESGAINGKNLASIFLSLKVESSPTSDLTPQTKFIAIHSPLSSIPSKSRPGVENTVDSEGSTGPPDPDFDSGSSNGPMSLSGSEELCANESGASMSTNSGVSDLPDRDLLVGTLNKRLTCGSNSPCPGPNSPCPVSNSPCPVSNSSFPGSSRKRKSVCKENVDPTSFLGAPVTPVTIRRYDDPGAPLQEPMRSRRILRPKYRLNRVSENGAEVVTGAIPTPSRGRPLLLIPKRPWTLRLRSNSPPIKQKRMFMDTESRTNSIPSRSVCTGLQESVSMHGRRRLSTQRRKEPSLEESKSKDALFFSSMSKAGLVRLPYFDPDILESMHSCEQVDSHGSCTPDKLLCNIDGKHAIMIRKSASCFKKRSLSAHNLFHGHLPIRPAETGRRARSVSPRLRSVFRSRSQSRSRNNRLEVSTYLNRSGFRSMVPKRVSFRSHPYYLDQGPKQSFTGCRSHEFRRMVHDRNSKPQNEECEVVKRRYNISMMKRGMKNMREMHTRSGQLLPDDTVIHVNQMSESILNLSIRDDPS